jgi:uncharacterized DUF497 family protein
LVAWKGSVFGGAYLLIQFTRREDFLLIKTLIWKADIIEKIESKHGVTAEEVEEIFRPGTMYRRGPRGKKRKGEDVYKAYGQTDSGRYLFVVFIYKLDHRALILSARDMDASERDLYRKG